MPFPSQLPAIIHPPAALLVETKQDTGEYSLTSFLAQGEVRRLPGQARRLPLGAPGNCHTPRCPRPHRPGSVLCALQTGVIGGGSRLFVEGQQAPTLHHVLAMADAAAVGGAPAAAAATGSEAGSSKRVLPGDVTEPEQDGSKRARLSGGGGSGRSEAGAGGAAAAAAAVGGADPLDRVPDAPMHLMRVRGIPRCGAALAALAARCPTSVCKQALRWSSVHAAPVGAPTPCSAAGPMKGSWG